MKTDLVLYNTKVYNSYFKSFFDADVYIKDGLFYHIDYEQKERSSDSLQPEKIVDAHRRFMIPGLIDIHMHIESSMLTPHAFCEYLVSCGVTTIVSEPHEMANVNGINGIMDMINAGSKSPIDVYYAIPSCVPSTSSMLETTGGSIGMEDMKRLFQHPMVACVGEVMNYRQIIKENNNLEIYNFIQYLRELDKTFPIEGHCPSLIDLDLSKFLYLGINADHTEHNEEEFRQRFMSGMFIELQEKMLSEAILGFIEKYNLYEYFCFVTDDVMADTLIAQGHLDAIVRKAISLSFSPEQAIYNATYTPAKRMNFLDRGAIDPGKIADFVLLSDLDKFTIDQTYKRGSCIYNQAEKLQVGCSGTGFDGTYYHSISLKEQEESVFRIPAGSCDEVCVRVMELNDKTTKTTEKLVTLPVKNGFIDWENSEYLLTAVFDRYKNSGNIGFGFITGDCHKKGAIASSHTHDSHNVLVAGSNAKDMTIAINRLIQLQGGIVAVENKTILSELQLNIGGILSGSSAAETGKSLKLVREAIIGLGYSHYNPIMSFCTITLPVSPELKLTDKGLVDVKNSKLVPLILP